jgi:hypothetical protein
MLQRPTRPGCRCRAGMALHRTNCSAGGGFTPRGRCRRRAPAGAGEEVVPASEYRALQGKVRELQRLLGKKTLENQIPARGAGSGTAKKRLLRSPRPLATTRLKTVADALRMARSNLAAQAAAATPRRRRGRRR